MKSGTYQEPTGLEALIRLAESVPGYYEHDFRQQDQAGLKLGRLAIKANFARSGKSLSLPDIGSGKIGRISSESQ